MHHSKTKYKLLRQLEAVLVTQRTVYVDFYCMTTKCRININARKYIFVEQYEYTQYSIVLEQILPYICKKLEFIYR